MYIDSPPAFQLTCNCGMRISGTNENGLVSLLKRHIESGKFHAAYLLRNKFSPGDSELEDVIAITLSMRKAERNYESRTTQG
jgi:hypothetical protein